MRRGARGGELFLLGREFMTSKGGLLFEIREKGKARMPTKDATCQQRKGATIVFSFEIEVAHVARRAKQDERR